MILVVPYFKTEDSFSELSQVLFFVISIRGGPDVPSFISFGGRRGGGEGPNNVK